jgi:hypothetical protein
MQSLREAFMMVEYVGNCKRSVDSVVISIFPSIREYEKAIYGANRVNHMLQ